MRELNEEMGTDVLAALTAAEKAELAALNPKIAQLEAARTSLTTARLEIETRKNTLEAQLETNLARRKAELEAALGALNLPQREQVGGGGRGYSTQLTQERRCHTHSRLRSGTWLSGGAHLQLEVAPR